MKSLVFDYYMQIDYSEVVSRCNFTIKCIPQNNDRQKIESYKIDLFPINKYCTGKDGLGNNQIYGANNFEHSTFYFHIKGNAITGLCRYEEDMDESRFMIYRHPYGLNRAGQCIRAYFENIRSGVGFNKDNYSTAVGIMHQLHHDFCYQPFITNINTTAEEALSLGKGVCQDYAHIFISLLHLANIPARYVTGLIVGEGASHAWVEILHNGKWYGLDPTNDKPVYDEHIKIGVGRDARDCAINRGIMHGGGLHIQKIDVKVKERIGR